MTRDDYGQAYQQGFNITVRFLLSRGAEAEGAIEIAQSAWVRGWEKIAQLRDDNMVSTWVNSIALNCYRKWFKQQSRLEVLTLPGGESPNFAALDTQRVLSFIPASDRLLLERRVHGYRLSRSPSKTTSVIRQSGSGYSAPEDMPNFKLKEVTRCGGKWLAKLLGETKDENQAG